MIKVECRYMPPVARLIKEVKGGAVGRIWMVTIREHRFPFLVKVRPTAARIHARLAALYHSVAQNFFAVR